MTTPQDRPPVPPQQPQFAAPQRPPQYAGAPAPHPQPGHTAPAHPVANPAIVDAVPRLRRIAVWTAIGALIVAALICVIWVLVGQSSDIAVRAFLTVLLLAGFAGISILETNLAPRREPWFSLVSMIVWVVTLLIGAVMIWMSPPPYDDYGAYAVTRFFKFLLIVLILQLGVLHLRLYSRAWLRHRTRFADIVAIATIALVGLLAVMLVFPLMTGEWLQFHDLYWRLTVAIAILAAVGTALLPLMNALFAPRAPRATAPAQPAYAPQQPVAPRVVAAPAAARPQVAVAPAVPVPPQVAAAPPAPVPPQAPPLQVIAAPPGWPTYAGTQMPLPMLPDGSPDWRAYYTGQPTPGAIAVSQFPPPAQPQPQQSAVSMVQPVSTQPPVPGQFATPQHPAPPVPMQPPVPPHPPVPPAG